MTEAVFDPKPILNSLPLLPGVYRFFDAKGDLLYVGKAKQLKKRVSSYFQKSAVSPRIRLMVSHIVAIETTVTRSEAEALLLENNLIKSLHPRYNILFRDDKSYPYIVLTGDQFPRLTYYRGSPNKQHQYFGPYPNTYAAKESLQLLQRIFRLRTCENSVFNHRDRPCLLYQIKRCTAPCVGLIGEADYQLDIRNTVLLLQGRLQEIEQGLHQQMMNASDAMLYEQAALFRDQLRALHIVQQKQFVESTGGATDADVIVLQQQEQLTCVNLSMVRGGRHLGDKSFFPNHAEHLSSQEVLSAFVSQHYLQGSVPSLLIMESELENEELLSVLSEQAGRTVRLITPATGERRQWLDMGIRNAQLALTQKAQQQGSQQRRLEKLQSWLDMPDLERIECFDISHTQGEATQASCVVFDQGGMQSSQYRRYNINDITPGDDYAAMRQVLTRRYQKLLSEAIPRPDLVLIDGGLGQLNVAIEVMAELGVSNLSLIGVAKGEERKAGLEQLIFPDGRVQSLSPDDPALHLIQQIRDEAHRFAITGHRAKRARARIVSSLEEIEGVGEKRRRNLLTHFGGLREISQASVEQLAQVQGISKALAEKIYQQLH